MQTLFRSGARTAVLAAASVFLSAGASNAYSAADPGAPAGAGYQSETAPAPAAVAAAARPTPGVQVNPETPASAAAPLPLRVLGREQFCRQLAQVFTDFGAANGFSKAQSVLLASGGTAQLLEDFRRGRASDFINVSALAMHAQGHDRAVPTGYVPLQAFVGRAMGLGDQIALALTPGELRFIPFAQRGLDLVVIAANTAALTPERAQKVAEMARGMQIKISILWVSSGGQAAPAIEDAQSLAWIAAATGGVFANLAGAGEPCQDRI